MNFEHKTDVTAAQITFCKWALQFSSAAAQKSNVSTWYKRAINRNNQILIIKNFGR